MNNEDEASLTAGENNNNSNQDTRGCNNNNNSNENTRGCLDYRSGIALVALITTTITVDNALHAALVPILPEHLYQNSVHGSLDTGDSQKNETSANISYSVGKNAKCNEADESEITIIEENGKVAILFTVKTLLQLVVSLIIGPVIKRVGCSIPMAVGYLMMIASSLTLAFGQSYLIMLIGGVLQGIDAACLMTAGMSLVAERFSDHKRRSRMIGIVLTGLGIGSLVGLPFGSVMHQIHGKMLPFLILSGLSVFCGIWFLVTVGFVRREKSSDEPGPSRGELLKDPSVLLITFGVVCSSIALPVLETTLPLWMMRTLCFEEWRLAKSQTLYLTFFVNVVTGGIGVAFVPACLLFIISTVVFGSISGYTDGMIWCVLSCLITAAACFWLPHSSSYIEVPMGLIGISNGMLDAGAYSAVADLVQKRFPDNCYGSGNALLEAAYCLSAVLGPFLTWLLLPIIGFEGCILITVCITLVGSIPISAVCCHTLSKRRKEKRGGEQFGLLERDDVP